MYPYRVEIGPGHNCYPPVGLELVAAALRPYSRAIDVVDLRCEAGHATDFLRPDTDLVCFSVNWDREREFVRREICSVPEGLLTVVGGRQATVAPEEWLAECPNVDILVRGDGENIVQEMARGRPLGGITGVSYREDGRVVHNPVRHCAPVRDDLWPDRSLRRYVYSLSVWGAGAPVTLDSVTSSRGCPFNCEFCSFDRNPWGKKRPWTARSSESVVREIEETDARLIMFTDDNFGHDMDRVKAICDLILERGIRKRYAVAARVEIAKRPDVLRKMERAGFSFLLLGIESAQDRTLRSMKKGFDTRLLREYFRVLRKTRMILHGSFIAGNIGETEDEMLQIGPFARQLGLDTMALLPLRYERHSGLEELIAQNPGHYVGPDGRVYSHSCPPKRYRQIRHRILRNFYGNPGQILRILIKGLKNEVFTLGMLARLPLLLARKALERLRRRRARQKRSRPAEQATQGARL